jgi:hypothetical protein
MAEPSRSYHLALEESKRNHAETKTFSGKLLRPHAPFIKELIDRHGVKSILDYGCGKGSQYTWVAGEDASIPAGMTIEQYWGVPVTKYDPAYPPFAAEPTGRFDLVICTHTLGAIPVNDRPWVVARLYMLARKAIYVAEKLGQKPTKKATEASTGWTREQWKAVLKHDSDVECVLSTRIWTETSGAVITRGKV